MSLTFSDEAALVVLVLALNDHAIAPQRSRTGRDGDTSPEEVKGHGTRLAGNSKASAGEAQVIVM